MKDSAYKISLDINGNGSQLVLNARHMDTGRKLYVSLRSGSDPYIIEKNCYAAFAATKPDGTDLYNACEIEGNEIVYEFTEQTCSVIGRSRCEIILYGPDDKVITSPRFALLVDGTICPEGKVVSTDEFTALTHATSEAIEATTAANQAADDANQAAKDAQTTEGRADEAAVRADDAAASANQAAQSANTASAAAGHAATAAQNAEQRASDAALEADDAATRANKATEAANSAAINANQAATKAAHTAKSLMVVGKAEGASIYLDDAIEQFFVGCRIFGKTTQDGNPTPGAPVELESVGADGSIDVKINGLNLFNLNSGIISGVGKPVTFIGNGFVLDASSASTRICRFKCNLNKGNTYILSYDTKNTVGTGIAKPFIPKYDQYLVAGKPFIPEEDADEIGIYVEGASVPTVVEVTNIQCNLTTEKKDYEVFKEQSVTISLLDGLNGIPVSSGGSYTDANGQQRICDEIDLANGVHIQRVLKVDNFVLDKTLDVCDVYVAYMPTVALGGGVYPYALCTHTSDYKYHTADSVHHYVDGSAAWVYVPKGADVTGLEMCVILKTPIETPLSEEELAAYASLHTYRGNTTVSNDSSAHMEIEYVMDAKKYIDSLAATPQARLADITLRASAWAGSNSLYSQVVSIPGITKYSKVDLLPSVEQLAIFFNKNVAFVTENEDGVVTVYAIGDKPTLDYTMQAQITEVEV